jgi:hypothetical protein
MLKPQVRFAEIKRSGGTFFRDYPLLTASLALELEARPVPAEDATLQEGGRQLPVERQRLRARINAPEAT